jgi:hypothetical protein
MTMAAGKWQQPRKRRPYQRRKQRPHRRRKQRPSGGGDISSGGGGNGTTMMATTMARAGHPIVVDDGFGDEDRD